MAQDKLRVIITVIIKKIVRDNNKLTENSNSNIKNQPDSQIREVKIRPTGAKANAEHTKLMKPVFKQFATDRQDTIMPSKDLSKGDFQSELEKTRRLSAVGLAAAKRHAAEKAKVDMPWEEDRKNGSRVYKLLGYTTSARVDQKFGLENRQRRLRRILAYSLAISMILLFLAIHKPISNISEFKRILGIESIMGEK